MTWGDADGQTLYLTAEDRVYRMRLKIAGRAAADDLHPTPICSHIRDGP